jgi:hypothetical protein
MKNLTLSISFFAMSFGLLGQTSSQTKTLITGEVENWEIIQRITNSVDTSTYFYYRFKNMEYQYLDDYASMIFSQQSDLDTLATKLKELANMETKINMTITVGRSVALSIVDFTDAIYIESLGDGYTRISRSNAIKLADEILANSYLLK